MWSFTNPFRSISRFAHAASVGEQCKMVLVVRKDLQMGVGKVAAQCCHAAIGGIESIRLGSDCQEDSADPQRKVTLKLHEKWLDAWFVTGSAKIVVQASSEEELLQIYERSKAANLPAFQVVDAGRTQVSVGSKTVVSVGPAPRSQVDAITGHLKLL